MAADSQGNLWVTNAPSTSISEFARGNTSPIATLLDSNLSSASYLAADQYNNVYVEGQSTSGIEIDELAAGGTTFKAISAPGEIGMMAGGLAMQKYRKVRAGGAYGHAERS